MDRNPYVLLGIPFGSSRAEATAAFARRAKRLRRERGGESALTELTWAMNQIDEVIRDPDLALGIYRIPADPTTTSPSGPGLFNPEPERLERQTTPGEDIDLLRQSASAELVRTVVSELARTVRIPDR